MVPRALGASGGDATPLEEIERAVQARAKDLVLDMATPGAADRMRALIRDEVAGTALDGSTRGPSSGSRGP